MKHRLATCATAALFAATLLTSGCTDLPDVDAQGCGNLVVNSDEDCDGFTDAALGENLACGEPETVNECSYTCDPAEGDMCPTGWGCGTDFRCRRAAGTFSEAPSSPWRFRVNNFAMGDVDGDGNADLIGNDLASVTVRFGEETGEFPTRLDLLTEAPKGPLSFDNFDDDDKLDVVVPISSGLFVLLGDDERDLSPVAYSPFDIEQNLSITFVPLESLPNNLDTEVVILAGSVIGFLHNIDTVMPANLPNGLNASTLVGRPVTADVHLNTRIAADSSPAGRVGRLEIAMAFADQKSVWLYTSNGTSMPGNDDLVMEPLATIKLPSQGTVSQGMQFADVNGDGWIDLMVSVKPPGPAAKLRVAVAYNRGDGTFDDAVFESLFDRIGGAVWPLAAADLNGDGYADYVLPEAITISNVADVNAFVVPTRLEPVAFATAQAFSEAAIGDFNGDTTLDVATAVEGLDGVDVFLNTSYGLFNRFRVDTDEPPRSLRVGDFDGDLLVDVAFVASGFGSKPDELTVIFGQHDSGPSEPVSMGALGFIDTLEPVSAVRSLESLDLITDLFVVSNSFPSRTSRSLAILTGSSSRRMTSPFALDSRKSDVPDVPLMALVGNFVGDSAKDIVAVADVPQNIGIDGAGPGDLGGGTILETNLWLVPGKGGDGSLDSAAASFIGLPSSDKFRTDCATWTAGDLDTDGMADEIVGVDRNATCFGRGFSPEPRLMVIRTDDGLLSVTVSGFPGVYRAPRELSLRDLDNDGDADLLILFVGDETSAGGGQTTIEGAAVVVVWNKDGNLSTAGLSVLEIPDGKRLHDVAALNIDADPVPELVVLAERGVYIADFDAATSQYLAPQLVIAQTGNGRIAAGDANGDGLTDLAFTVGSDVHVYLQNAQSPLGATPEVPALTEGGQ